MEVNKPKKFRNKKKSKIISFDSEIVTKDNAEEILKNVRSDKKQKKKLLDEGLGPNIEVHLEKQKKNKKRKHDKSLDTNEKHLELVASLYETESKENGKQKKKKRKNVEQSNSSLEGNQENELAEEPEKTDEADPEAESVKPPKKESKRTQKRKKFEEQEAAKKLKSELGFQEKALSYLSKWKHCRSEWKFEKLRQVWLQQNLFDSSKIPDEFWETTVEYFGGSKGQSRQQLLDEAVKIVEQEEQSDLTIGEDKLKRARDIVQHLQ